MIQKLLSLKNEKLEKQEYLKTIIDPLAIALEFYKEQSDDNYKRIIEGIQSEQITLLEKRQSYIDTKSGNTYILLNHDDSDVFCLVHEFAHFIDRNHKPAIVPDSHCFLAESFAFYMEKRLEKFLSERGYHALVQTRRNNRIVSETKMLTAIENQLFYEEQYQKTKNIETISFEAKKIKTILPYHMTNLVNVLLSYPLANILSEYLINHSVSFLEQEFVEVCTRVNLYDALDEFNQFKQDSVNDNEVSQNHPSKLSIYPRKNCNCYFINHFD